jgi:hypothetical protein
MENKCSRIVRFSIKPIDHLAGKQTMISDSYAGFTYQVLTLPDSSEFFNSF